MLHNQKIFKGWVNTKQAESARQVRMTSNILSHLICSRHVSAKDLIQMQAPLSLLKHAQLHPNDRIIWDESYKEEYYGLKNLDMWEVISEEEYKLLKQTTNAKTLPAMAISVIKATVTEIPPEQNIESLFLASWIYRDGRNMTALLPF